MQVYCLFLGGLLALHVFSDQTIDWLNAGLISPYQTLISLISNYSAQILELH